MSQAPLAVTPGDPAGIGPELTAKAWQALRGEVAFFLIGDPDRLRPVLPDIDLVQIERTEDCAAAMARGLPVLWHGFTSPITPGTPDPKNAAAVVSAIERAVSLVQSGQASGLVTNPIHKQILQDHAGFAFPGHTEFLAHLAGIPRPVMMLAAPGLRVVPVTIHIALAEVPAALTPALLDDTLRITDAALRRDFGLAAPRIAVAGLNPHAGEGGKMGREEIDVMTPVLEALRDDGLDIRGPLPPDTMFHAEARAAYDVAVCPYHDQALIPLKTLDFHGGVNITLGLPFIRTSPDHGTAFDIAGQGKARPDSLIAAIREAAKLAEARA